METAYREFNWEWKQWDGTWHSDTVYQPYQRYPRTKIEPPAVELEIEKDPTGAKVVVTEPLTLTKANEARLLHQINLFRELFGEATVLTEDLEQFTRVKVKRLNWEPAAWKDALAGVAKAGRAVDRADGRAQGSGRRAPTKAIDRSPSS